MVGFLEKGEIVVPNAVLALALARELGVSVEWLVNGDGHPASQPASDSEAAQVLNESLNTSEIRADCSNTASGADDSRALCTSCGKVA